MNYFTIKLLLNTIEEAYLDCVMIQLMTKIIASRAVIVNRQFLQILDAMCYLNPNFEKKINNLLSAINDGDVPKS